jgi:hypothetical protein
MESVQTVDTTFIEAEYRVLMEEKAVVWHTMAMAAQVVQRFLK